MKIKVTYDTGSVITEVPDNEVVDICQKIERQSDMVIVSTADVARRKRKPISVETV